MAAVADRFSMAGKTALVTGASSGFGVHFSRVLAEAGARVVCAARRKDRLDAVVKEIAAAGGEAVAVELDLTQVDSVRSAFDAGEAAFGQIDVLVNNAGQITFEPFPNISDEHWEQIINTNLSGTFRVSREFSSRLIEAGRPGAIVTISSITGMLAKDFLAGYGSTKAALIQLTKQMALDLLPHKIRSNAIAPGYFLTEMVDWYFESPEGKAEIPHLPGGRLGEFHELDGALLLLASDASSFMNGAIIPVDNGHVIKLS
jgi:NAD(P)-dependent dehydrogenase (short-subunit alcohol dehydrogenase family)